MEDPVIVLKNGKVYIYDDEHPDGYQMSTLEMLEQGFEDLLDR